MMWTRENSGLAIGDHGDSRLDPISGNHLASPLPSPRKDAAMADRPITVLQLLPDLNWGGVERGTLESPENWLVAGTARS